MESVTVLLNSLSCVALLVGFFILLAHRKNQRMTPPVFWSVTTALLLFFLLSLSNILEHSQITSVLDPTEDMMEIAYLMLLLFAIFSWRRHQHFLAFARQELWMRSAFQSMRDGMVVTDPEGKILLTNESMRELLGSRTLELRGLQSKDVLRFYDKATQAPLDFDPFARLYGGPSVDRPGTGVLLASRSGQLIPVMETTSIVRTQGGMVLGGLGVYHNLSEYESLLEQISQTRKMEALGQLAGGVAHDLNNMLAGIINAAQVLSNNISNPTARDENWRNSVDLIIESADLAGDLTANLLAFGRKGRSSSRHIPVRQMIHQTTQLARRTIDRLIEIRESYPIQELHIHGDRSQLQNAVLNLVLNARDALSGQGTISVELSELSLSREDAEKEGLPIGRYVSIVVADNGRGIPEEAMPHIFEPFFTTKGAAQGTGLGLPAVKSTVESHEGSIRVDSSEQGTRFELILPAAEPLNDETRTEINRSTSGSPGMTVLIIEDEPILRASTAMLLEDYEWNVLTASTGKAGVEMLMNADDAIDVVLLDMIMPESNGVEVFAHLREVDPRIPIVMTSGFTDKQNIPEGVPFVRKPYRMTELLEALRDAVNGTQ